LRTGGNLCYAVRMKLRIDTLDWQRSFAVRRLTYQQQGLWLVLCVRMKHEPKLPWTFDDIRTEVRAAKTRCTQLTRDLEALVQHGMLLLDEAGVYSLPEDGPWS